MWSLLLVGGSTHLRRLPSPLIQECLKTIVQRILCMLSKGFSVTCTPSR